jgi:hypothetical protein
MGVWRVWFILAEKQNIINEVLSIVGKFPYRSVYYEIKDKEVRPSEVTSFPGDSDKIESEPDDTFPDYERG